jgi:hypothetical protein
MYENKKLATTKMDFVETIERLIKIGFSQFLIYLCKKRKQTFLSNKKLKKTYKY